MDYKFGRIDKLPAYVFSRLNSLKHDAILSGQEIFDFGMGNPDSKAPQEAIDTLISESQKDNTHGYSLSKGIFALRDAFANYYHRRFAVDLDQNNEVTVTIGSKEGITSLALALTEGDEYIVVPTPGYPIHSWGFVIAGSKVKRIDYRNFFENFVNLVETAEKKPRAVILNYPANPTAATVDLDFYQEMVNFCKKHEIFIISDLAYAEIYFTDEVPPSILQIPGAKDIAIEFTSMTKSFSMAGWRVGFAAGNSHLIEVLTKIKSYLDYGMFTPVQLAAANALEKADYYPKLMRNLYKERRDLLCNGFEQAGWQVNKPDASMFVWTKIPNKFKQLSSLDFCTDLFINTGIVISPGSGFGEEGEGYVRIALVQNSDKIRKAVEKLKAYIE